MTADKRPIYTVGHSTRTADELLAILKQANTTLVADVRRFPSSRRHPQFNSAEMARWLHEAGIAYVHLAGLGGRRQPVVGSKNGGWHERGFQGYADHMSSTEFKTAFAELEAMAAGATTAIMCAEAVWWRCHRRLIADALVARNWHVVDLGPPNTDHALPDFAVVGADGSVTYPPQQMTLPTT